MKNLMVAFSLLVSVYAQDLFACSYMIDGVSKSAELEKVALASLGDVKILDSALSDFSFFESKPTPMCPEELTFSLTLSVAYESAMNVCAGQLKITKIEPWVSGLDDIYHVSGRNSFRCKK